MYYETACEHHLQYDEKRDSVSSASEEILQPGTIIDRYGSNGTGKFFSPEGTPYRERALPPFMENQPYTKYEILKPMKIKLGEIAPWFEQQGGGKQFLSDFSVEELRDMGIIRILE